MWWYYVALGKDQCSQNQLHLISLRCGNFTLITLFDMANFSGSLPQWFGSSVSLVTNLSFIWFIGMQWTEIFGQIWVHLWDVHKLRINFCLVIKLILVVFKVTYLQYYFWLFLMITKIVDLACCLLNSD